MKIIYYTLRTSVKITYSEGKCEDNIHPVRKRLYRFFIYFFEKGTIFFGHLYIEEEFEDN